MANISSSSHSCITACSLSQDSEWCRYNCTGSVRMTTSHSSQLSLVDHHQVILLSATISGLVVLLVVLSIVAVIWTILRHCRRHRYPHKYYYYSSYSSHCRCRVCLCCQKHQPTYFSHSTYVKTTGQLEIGHTDASALFISPPVFHLNSLHSASLCHDATDGCATDSLQDTQLNCSVLETSVKSISDTDQYPTSARNDPVVCCSNYNEFDRLPLVSSVILRVPVDSTANNTTSLTFSPDSATLRDGDDILSVDGCNGEKNIDLPPEDMNTLLANKHCSKDRELVLPVTSENVTKILSANDDGATSVVFSCPIIGERPSELHCCADAVANTETKLASLSRSPSLRSHSLASFSPDHNCEDHVNEGLSETDQLLITAENGETPDANLSLNESRDVEPHSSADSIESRLVASVSCLQLNEQNNAGDIALQPAAAADEAGNISIEPVRRYVPDFVIPEVGGSDVSLYIASVGTASDGDLDDFEYELDADNESLEFNEPIQENHDVIHDADVADDVLMFPVAEVAEGDAYRGGPLELRSESSALSDTSTSSGEDVHMIAVVLNRLQFVSQYWWTDEGLFIGIEHDIDIAFAERQIRLSLAREDIYRCRFQCVRPLEGRYSPSCDNSAFAVACQQ